MEQNFLVYSNILLWVFQILILFALILLFRQFGKVHLSSGDAIERDGVPIGKKIPSFEGESIITNEVVNFQSDIGKPTLLAFVSPGCKPCRELISDWNKANLKYGNKINFLLIGQGKREAFSRLKEFKSVNGEFLLDPDQNILRSCNVRVTPFAFMLDHQGKVKTKGVLNDIDGIRGFISSLESNFEVKNKQLKEG